jgi:tRNA uridine 5-carboxymethylaminomethyl modification enzyme
MSALDRLLTAGKVDPEKLQRAGFSELPATAGITWAQLLKRPEVTIEPLLAALRDELARDPLLAGFAAVSNAGPHSTPIAAATSAQDDCVDEHIARAMMRNEARAVETEIKFAGYLEQQKKSIERLKAAEYVTIPDWIEYSTISGLSREMRETLERIRPMTIGQASRIPGVTPAALTLVHVSIKLQGKQLDAKRRATA